MRCAWLLAALSACAAVDDDLLGPRASPCALGDVGVWVDVTPPDVRQVDPDPGVRAFELSPFDTSVLYAATHAQGIWRSADCGATWDHTNDGINGPVIENALTFDLALDPFVPDTIYLTPRFGGGSVWMSGNAGVHWENLVPAAVAMPLYDSDIADLSKLAVFPDGPHHLLVSSQVPWVGHGDDAGFLEGRRTGEPGEPGEAWTWTVHPPAPGMGVAQWLAILDARTWLISSSYIPTGEGTWITRDAGATFTRVDDHEASTGGFQLYRSPSGALYRPSQSGLLRSTDDAATWVDVFVGLGLGGTQVVIGDGTTLYVSSAVPDGADIPRLFNAPEDPGDRDWSAVPMPSTNSVQRFAYDHLRHVLYAFNGYSGIQRLRLR